MVRVDCSVLWIKAGDGIKVVHDGVAFAPPQSAVEDPAALQELMAMQRDPEVMREVEALMDDPEFVAVGRWVDGWMGACCAPLPSPF